jgi:zinc transporter 1
VFGLGWDVLVLVSDGFHNLSDVVALGIGLWASKKSRAAKSMQYSYGFARTELLGALVNGCFLLSLGFYVLLEAIPKFIFPEKVEDVGWYFVIGASVGLGLNVLGALVFFVTGKGHSHAGHSHEHGGHSDHTEQDETEPLMAKPQKKKKDNHGHGHAHHDAVALAPSGKAKEEAGDEHGEHSHDSHDHAHDGGHEHAHEEGHKKKEKKEKHGHSHEHGEHEEKKEKKKHKEHGHEHDHEDHAHGHGKKDKKKKADDHGHAHGGGGGDAHAPHGDHHYDEEMASHAGEAHADHNLHAIFLHFLGDALSSVFVLATALLWKFFPLAQNPWIVYVDPASSLIVVGIILFSTIPLVRSVLAILLQRVPKGVDSDRVSSQLKLIPGVIGVHDLHIWELVSGLNLASVHLDVRGDGAVDFNKVLKKVRRVFHRNKIHSVTVQPEFVR